MATGDNLKNTKAWVSAYGAAAVGFVAPAAAYLATVDSDGISGTEWLHSLLIAVIAAVPSGAAVGALVYKVENKPKDS